MFTFWLSYMHDFFGTANTVDNFSILGFTTLGNDSDRRWFMQPKKF